MHICRYHWLILLLLLPAPGTAAVVADGEMAADTRILIDISGSMKKNDPNNLRRPALRLLVGLLPDNSRAGVWTFGQYVNMQVPLGRVDKAWRARARKQAAKIHSRGLFTNIEAVIRRSIKDWQGPGDKYRRHLILLTDGVVDVSKESRKSAASRQRIIEQLIPELQALNARVHTIALSQRADHELMRQLSDATGGWYEQVDDAGQLQRVFLRLFEKVGRPDTLPLKDNRFHVDGKINEATLLVFRGADARPTQIKRPDGKQFGAANAPSNITWHRDEGYDMLTISKPLAGEWHILAAVDPDNRVMVITDLKMQVSELPNRIVSGEQVPLQVQFTDRGEKVEQQEFLDVVALTAELTDAAGPAEPRPIRDDGEAGDSQAGDGTFTLLLGEGVANGRATLVIEAAGKTFQRQKRQTFEVLPAIDLQLLPAADQSLTAQAVIDTELLRDDSIELQAQLQPEGGGEAQPLMLLPSARAGVWETRIDPSALVGSWQLTVTLRAQTQAGNPLFVPLDPIAIEGSQAPPPQAVAVEPEPAPPVAAPEAEENWVLLGSLFAAGNAVALLLAGLVFWWWRRRASSNLIQLVDDDEPEQPEQPEQLEQPPADDAAVADDTQLEDNPDEIADDKD